MARVLRPSTGAEPRRHAGGFRRDVAIEPLGLKGSLAVPPARRACIVFAHGSGSSRLSPRNAAVAEALGGAGFATLLFDLLRPEEERNRANVFDIPLLADRLVAAVRWLERGSDLGGLPLGLFGASTGAAAALVAASVLGKRVGAVVSRGGRPDLALEVLDKVHAATLLIVGGADLEVLELNRCALGRLREPKALAVIPGATHLFPEPGAMEQVVARAIAWFDRYLCAADPAPSGSEGDNAVP